MLPRVSEVSSSVLANQYWLHCHAFEWARGLFSAPLDAFVPGWRSSHPWRPPISKEAVSMVTVPDRLVHCTKYDVWIMEGGTRLHVFISWKHFRGWWFHCFDLCRLFTKKGEVICLFSLWGIETHLNKEVFCTNLNLKYQFRVQLSDWKLIFGHWRSTGHVLVATLFSISSPTRLLNVWIVIKPYVVQPFRLCTRVRPFQLKLNPLFSVLWLHLLSKA